MALRWICTGALTMERTETLKTLQFSFRSGLTAEELILIVKIRKLPFGNFQYYTKFHYIRRSSQRMAARSTFQYPSLYLEPYYCNCLPLVFLVSVFFANIAINRNIL